MKLWFLRTFLGVLCAVSWISVANAEVHVAPMEAVADSESKLTIITSIPPLALITREIASGLADVHVLIHGAASPHDYALTIGQALSLQEADMLVWVGPQFEQFLEDIKLPPLSLSIASTLEDEESHNHHTHDQEHQHGDSHLWLSRHYVEVFASKLAAQLQELRPKHSNKIANSLAHFLDHYKQAIDENTSLLSALEIRAFVAHHDGYTLLLPRYSLEQRAALTRVPHERISAKRLASIEKSLNGAACLLAEVDEAQEAKRYSRILDLPLVEIDILASKQEFARFADFERALGRSLIRCFKSNK